MTIIDDVLDMPPGKVNMVMGSAGPISDTLCADPRMGCISFTGSTPIGVQLIENTAKNVTRLALELGGNAPFIVFEDADLDKAADNLMANKFRGSGQTCVCTNRVYAHSDIAAAFAEKLKERCEKMTVGNGMDEGVDMGPLIDSNGYNKVREHVQDALDKGATIVTGKLMDEPKEKWGCFHPPTVLRGVTREMACCKEETFGPLVPILEFTTEEEAVQFGNDTEFGLASYVFSGDLDRAERVASQLRFGHCGINTGTGPTPEAPFGGMKESGWGREGGEEGLFDFVEPQTIPHG
jgi:succinate-semialdehyde dehydrogenase/glutarate-semialdehyde dehydrogenase